MPANASPFRLLRTWTIAGTVLALAATAHVAGGGILPAPLILAALAALTALGAMLATGLRLGLRSMAILLLGSQLALHEAFGMLAPPASGPGAAPALAAEAAAALSQAGHDHSGQGAAQAMALMHATGGADPLGMLSGTPLTFWMTVAHLAAALGTAVLLAKGEAALWALADWLRPLAAGTPAPAALPVRPRRVPTTHTPPQLKPWRELRSERLRGPPPSLSFA